MRRASPERIRGGMYWDKAWSLVEGCSPVSEGCRGCWSARQTEMRSHQTNKKIRARYAGLTNEDCSWTGKVCFQGDDLDKPLKVKKPTVWAVWNDLFNAGVLWSNIQKAFEVMIECPRHTFLVLTKRPGRMEIFLTEDLNYKLPLPLPNVYLGVTAENQKRADERIPILLQIPAAKRFVSIEPMLSLVDVGPYLPQPESIACEICGAWNKNPPVLDWVIVGGESGPGARPMHPDWVRSVRDRCLGAGVPGVPFFFKQWGGWCPDDFSTVTETGFIPKRCWAHRATGEAFDWSYPHNCEQMMWRGKKAAGRILDGQVWDQTP